MRSVRTLGTNVIFLCVLTCVVDGLVFDESQTSITQARLNQNGGSPIDFNAPGHKSLGLDGFMTSNVSGEQPCWMHPPPPAADEKIVHFLRHGQGWHNIDSHIAFTVADPSLTLTGVGQAMAVRSKTVMAEFLSGDPLRRVELLVISPAVRTLQTAFYAFADLMANAKDAREPAVLLEPLAREVDPGYPTAMSCMPSPAKGEALLKGYKFSRLVEQYRALPEGWHNNSGLWAPDYDRVADRFELFTQKLLSRPERRIIVVTHAVFMAQGLGVSMANCGIESRVLSRSGEWRHLPPAHCLGKPEVARVDPCECLPWKNTYQSGLVACGEGLEGQFCRTRRFKPERNFFQKMSGNKCAKAAPSAKVNDSWCYVPAVCGELRGGRTVNDYVSWKWCEEGARLVDFPLCELFETLAKDDLLWAASMSLALAYPAEARFNMSQVRPFWDGAAAKESMNQTLRVQVQEIVDYGKPKIICEALNDASSEQPCKNDSDLYVVNDNELWYMHHFKMPVCVAGCEQ